MLDANQPLSQTVRGELLLGIQCSQMAEVLNNRRLAALKVCKASLDLPKQSLDLGNIGPHGAKQRQHEIFRTIDHRSL